MSYKNIPFSKVKPLGKLKDNMQNDLNSFIGNLDDLVPDLIKNDEIYKRDRRTKYTPPVEVGAVDVGEGVMPQFMWWNCETQGNWMDGFLRTSILLEDEKMKQKAFTYMEKYLESQDEDGYIGIYDEDLRFNHEAENGEMWAQATILRTALAYYEYKQDEKILEKVLRALDVIMKGYPIDGKNPFTALDRNNDYECGVGHSLMVVDVFEKAYLITDRKEYLEYCKWLYKAFSSTEKTTADLTESNLLGDAKLWAHGVHTTEQVRALIFAAKCDEKYKGVLDRYFVKLRTCLCPSGGPIGDEYIAKRDADSTRTGYEYCSMHELLHSYIKMYELTGDLSWMDKAQWLFYNAAMGAQFRDSKITENSSISYLKSDNSYSMTGIFQTEDGTSKQLRYKYSPTHQDAAVCCVPNAGRIYTYFYEAMWYQDKNSLLKAFHGDSVVNTVIDGVELSISESSNYPYGNSLKYSVNSAEKVRAKISIRIPSYAKSVKCSIDSTIENGLLVIEKDFLNDEFRVEFEADVLKKTDLLGDDYFTYKDMLLSLPIDYMEKISKEHPVKGFYDIYCIAKNDDYLNYEVSVKSKAKEICEDGAAVTLYNKKTSDFEDVKLIHIGKAPLRRVTFNKVK